MDASSLFPSSSYARGIAPGHVSGTDNEAFRPRWVPTTKDRVDAEADLFHNITLGKWQLPWRRTPSSSPHDILGGTFPATTTYRASWTLTATPTCLDAPRVSRIQVSDGRQKPTEPNSPQQGMWKEFVAEPSVLTRIREDLRSPTPTYDHTPPFECGSADWRPRSNPVPALFVQLASLRDEGRTEAGTFHHRRSRPWQAPSYNY